MMLLENWLLLFITKGGGLDWSRHGLDRDLDLDAKKKSVSTRWTFSTVQKPSLDSLDYSKNWDFSIFVEISISTPKKSQSRQSRFSQQFEKRHLDVSRHLDLDLDWSRLSRPPTLVKFDEVVIEFTSSLVTLLNCKNNSIKWPVFW